MRRENSRKIKNQRKMPKSQRLTTSKKNQI